MNEPTVISLYDTIHVLSERNQDWLEDEFSCLIFVWQSSFFLDTHVEEVCKDKCPDLLGSCKEYRENETINGLPIPDTFGIKALDYIIPKSQEDYDLVNFGTSPIRNAYFSIKGNQGE